LFLDVTATNNEDNPQNSKRDKQQILQAGKVLSKVLCRLTRKESMLFHQVFKKKYFATREAKKLIQNVLMQLPDISLKAMAALLQFEEKVLEQYAGYKKEEYNQDITKRTIIGNAGLCILAPYLPVFFDHLGLIHNGKFKTKASAYRALYILQYLVNGKQKNYEYHLQLNKLLCGLNINEPIPAYKRLSKWERDEAEDLLASVLQHWKALKSTTINGLRTSFLERKAILTEQDNSWTVQVEKKSFDLLMDSIPWSFNLVKFSWMSKMLKVEW
jgi:hypothetical protein